MTRLCGGTSRGGLGVEWLRRRCSHSEASRWCACRYHPAWPLGPDAEVGNGAAAPALVAMRSCSDVGRRAVPVPHGSREGAPAAAGTERRWALLWTGRRATSFGPGIVEAAYFTPGGKVTEDAAPFSQSGCGPGDTAANW
jgi:hypothetical protein